VAGALVFGDLQKFGDALVDAVGQYLEVCRRVVVTGDPECQGVAADAALAAAGAMAAERRVHLPRRSGVAGW